MSITDSGIQAAIDALVPRETARDREIEVDDRKFALEKNGAGVDKFRELKPEKPAAAKFITLHSLTGVLDYVTENADTLDLAHVTVHIAGPRDVRVIGPLREIHRDREEYLAAFPAADDVAQSLNTYLDQADFVLRLQRFFEDSDERKALIAIAGSLTDEATRTASDDGVTQLVATKQGSSLGTKAVKNPWLLTPKRSFTEITLEPVPFVLRVMFNGAGKASSLALFEADGGSWKVDAIRKIYAFLSSDHSAVGRAWKLVG